MLSLRRGSVTAVTERHEGLVRLEVDGRPCVAYPGMTGPVALGDDVLVNAQAVELGLGSGGFDVLYANLTRGLDLEGEPGAHVMKLPYTPLQYAVRHAEEDGVRLESLGGLPVVCCSLHSQVAPAAAGLGEGRRVAYVQVPGGALPGLPLGHGSRAPWARARRDHCCRRGLHRGRRRVRLDRRGLRLGSRAGVRRRSLLDRARHRGDREPMGARRAFSGGGSAHGPGARRDTGPRGPLFGRRPARASPRSFASHAGRARARRRRRDRLARRAGDAGRSRARHRRRRDRLGGRLRRLAALPHGPRSG